MTPMIQRHGHQIRLLADAITMKTSTTMNMEINAILSLTAKANAIHHIAASGAGLKQILRDGILLMRRVDVSQSNNFYSEKCI